jgi:hypothetical protein
MRIGLRNSVTTAILAVALSFVAKDLSVPLMGLSLFGLFDRLIAAPWLRGRVG